MKQSASALALVLCGCQSLLGIEDVTLEDELDGGGSDGFTLALEDGLRVVRNEDVNVTVTLTRDGYDGAVDLGFDLPVGVSASPDVIAAGATELTVTLSAAATATLGPSTVSVSGNAGELSSSSPEVSLMVADPAGSFDSTWDGDGLAVFATSNPTAAAKAIGIAPDGSVVIGGLDQVDMAGSQDWLFIRLDPATGDELQRNSRLTFDKFEGMTIQPDGRVVAVGSDIDIDTPRYALARQTANDLSSDATFGTGGRATSNGVPGGSTGFDVAVDGQGRIVTGGTAGSDGFLTRFTSAGILDSTFSGNGVVFNEFPTQDMSIVNAIAIDGSDRVYATGSSFSPFDIYLYRFDSTGAPDTTFGTGGLVSLGVTAIQDFAHDLALGPGGKIAVVGESANNYLVSLFTDTGQVDTGFNPGGTPAGLVTDSVPGANTAVARAVLMEPDGKLWVAGTATGTSISRGFLARYNPDGTLDTTFNGTGRRFFFGTATNAAQMEIWGIARQADGRILLCGNFRNDQDIDDGFVVVRIWN